MADILDILIIIAFASILFIKFNNIIHVIIKLILAILIGLRTALYIIFGLNVIMINQVIIPENNITIASY